MKVVMLTGLFPQLKGANCYQRGKGTGTSVPIAAKRAMDDLFKRMKVRKTFTEFSFQGTAGDVPEETHDTGEASEHQTK